MKTITETRPPVFFLLAAGFVLFTMIGTFSHEMGHYGVATYLGYEAEINYTQTLWDRYSASPKHQFYVASAGPVQTMVTGIMGIALLFLFRRSFRGAEKLTFVQWLLIFLSLFWLRQTANWVLWTANYFLSGNFSEQGDEIRVARYLELPQSSIMAFTGVLGLLVLAVVLFKFIPKVQRGEFILAGMVGGVTGYFLWLG